MQVQVDPQVAALSKLLTDVGIGLNSYTWEQYQDMVVEYGMQAVIAGVQIAADNGKQNSFKYVSACIVNAHKGVGAPNVSNKHAKAGV